MKLHKNENRFFSLLTTYLELRVSCEPFDNLTRAKIFSHFLPGHCGKLFCNFKLQTKDFS